MGTTGTAGVASPGAAGRAAAGSGGTGTATAGTAAATAGTGAAGTGAAGGTGGSTATAGSTAEAGSGAGTGAAGAAGGTGGPAAAEVMGCGTTKLLENPADTAELGPWPIGTRTIEIPVGGVMMKTEVWYPGKPGSEAGKPEVTYDLRDYLGSNRTKVPDSVNKNATCKRCFRDIPIDDAHGPYPAVIFVHGLFSIRIANTLANTLWASRGFIVLAADHPGLYLSDGAACPGAMNGALNIERDVRAEIAGLTSGTGLFEFIGKNVDVTRIGLSGHSTGAGGVAGFANLPGVQIILPLAPLTPPSPNGAGLKSVLFMTGLSDSVTPFSGSESAYTGSNPPIKRLIGITGGNHMNVTDLCWQKNDMGKNSLEVGLEYNACSGLALVVALFQCGTVDGPKATESVGYATAAALEETLHCQDRKAAFDNLKTKYPIIGRFDHKP